MIYSENEIEYPADKTSINDQSIFIWIDILGFSQIVDNGEKYDELVSLLIKFQEKFLDENYYTSRVISDGIIIEISSDHHKKDHNTFIEILNDLGEKQFNFIMENNHFIRGGIALGTKIEYNCISSKNEATNIVSNGLARAYNLESTGISWPIIGINEKYLTAIPRGVSGSCRLLMIHSIYI